MEEVPPRLHRRYVQREVSGRGGFGGQGAMEKARRDDEE